MTDIEIVNAALLELGCLPITAMDTSSAESTIALKQYGLIRDALLESRQWTFAKTRIQLTQDVTSPLFGFSNRYTIPSTVLTVIRVVDGNGRIIDPFEREGSYILTDEPAPIYAEVLQRVPESNFSPLFVKALIAQCAADWAIPLTENRTTADSWELKAQERLQIASATDGKQGTMKQMDVPAMPGRRGRWQWWRK